ncbi:Bax inhibitor-1/YccA family protein [Polluticaenibacter yanchengensis]|uniref:Bax inhibitor-1/YccA family protein n=1 Tax=Polluticaenibacter yanchengensis TaxID=3014562 RepID=A0ABT4UM10_9BACT|nr:Bax inhibitor-1/YccA family protein [Chitinophagaceae bacterium LY-5]
MALLDMKSSNPALGEKTFKELSYSYDKSSAMTARGTMLKLGFMLILMLASAFYTWHAFYNNTANIQAFIWGGAIGGFVIALVLIFKKEWSPFLAPLYALLEGLFIGGISATYNFVFAASMPNIITNAVGLTASVAIAMFLLYNFRIIKATEKFKSIIITATAGIAIFYLIVMVLRLFNVPVAFMHDSSMLGIGISLFIVAIAALNLILDFDFIEKGEQMGAPKYMEWYGAFGLMVTLVWLYLEILRLLSRFASNK